MTSSPAVSPNPNLPDIFSLQAVLFDLDGVLTPTADVHMIAWGELFIPVLERHGVAPYVEDDYFAYVDGKPRYEGVASLLAARGIEIPYGEPTDEPGAETVCGLGNLKNELFNTLLSRDGVTPYAGSMALVHALKQQGIEVAVVSSSRNAHQVLQAAGIDHEFEVVVEGRLAAERGVVGKPAPDTYLYAANMLGLDHTQCAVVEDAESGVQAGRAGNFALVVGVDRGAGAQALLDNGADLVVNDLAELLP